MDTDRDTTTRRHEDLIYDVGLHKGEDTAFYLAKGFRVVAFEADPDLVALNQKTFSKEIADERLTIVAGAIVEDPSVDKVTFYKNRDFSVWGTVSESWAKRNESAGTKIEPIEVDTVDFAACLRRFGVPYFMKVDIEGADAVCIHALYGFEERPAYLSLESEKVSFDALVREINTFRDLGYDKFAAVRQDDVALQKQPDPAEEGDAIEFAFQEGSSGLFGRDLPDPWKTDEQVIKQYKFIFVLYRLFGDHSLLVRSRVGRIFISLLSAVCRRGLPGWYDTHARHSSAR